MIIPHCQIPCKIVNKCFGAPLLREQVPRSRILSDSARLTHDSYALVASWSPGNSKAPIPSGSASAGGDDSEMEKIDFEGPGGGQ